MDTNANTDCDIFSAQKCEEAEETKDGFGISKEVQQQLNVQFDISGQPNTLFDETQAQSQAVIG